MEVVPYTPAHRQAVDRLNVTLAEAGSEWSFPIRERPADAERLPAWDESFVAVDGNNVYGGYILKHRQFFLEGTPLDVAALQLPLSLGEIDSDFAHVSVALFFDAIRRSPYLYSLGLGSEDSQYARLLTAAGWQHITVPFYFRVRAANRFAREIRLPPDKAMVEKTLRALGHARLTEAALSVRRLVTGRRRSARRPAPTAHVLPRFDGFVDSLFSQNVESYGFVADRRAAALRHVYPTGKRRYLRLAVANSDDVIGWALVLDTEMADHKYFGDLRVGTIADGFAAPDHVPAIVAAADAFLESRAVDIVVSNQLHPGWCAALRRAGYESGPSNFFFYYSEELGERLATMRDWERRIHLNRGDGEGPGHL